jgi:hypothetical protein
MRLGRFTAVLALLLAGCLPVAPPRSMNDDGGAPSIDGGEPVDAATPRVMPGGLVTSPRRGDVVDEASAAPIVVRGVPPARTISR